MASENEVEPLIGFVFALLNDGFITMSNVRDGLTRARDEGNAQSVAVFQHVLDYHDSLRSTYSLDTQRGELSDDLGESPDY